MFLDFLDMLMIPFTNIFNVEIFKYLFEIVYPILLFGIVFRLVKQ